MYAFNFISLPCLLYVNKASVWMKAVLSALAGLLVLSPRALLPSCPSSELWEEWQIRSMWHLKTEDILNVGHVGIYHLKTQEEYQLARSGGGVRDISFKRMWRYGAWNKKMERQRRGGWELGPALIAFEMLNGHSCLHTHTGTSCPAILQWTA